MASILFTEPAEYDLLDVEYYIHIHLCNPQAADRIVDGIIETIGRLEIFPEKHPLVNDELLSSVGLRMAQFDNYNIFYYYDDMEDVIHIIRILYNRSDWKNILRL